MEQMYNLQHDNFVANLVYEEKENYTLTSKEDERLPSEFTSKEKKRLDRWCYKLGFEGGVTGFIEYIDEFYLPNMANTEFNVNLTVSAILQRYRDVVYMNEKSLDRWPYSVEELIINLKSSREKIVNFIVGPFSLPFIPYLLFYKTIINRVELKLKEGSYTNEELIKFSKSINNILVNKPLYLQDKDLLKKINKLYRKELNKKQSINLLKASPKIPDSEQEGLEVGINHSSNSVVKWNMEYVGNDGSLRVQFNGKVSIEEYNTSIVKSLPSLFEIKFLEEVYEEFKDKKVFNATKKKFINTFNLTGNANKIKIVQYQFFFYLVRMIESKLESKIKLRCNKEYRKQIFKRTSPPKKDVEEFSTLVEDKVLAKFHNKFGNIYKLREHITADKLDASLKDINIDQHNFLSSINKIFNTLSWSKSQF